MSDFTRMYTVVELAEEEAFQQFGKDRIDTKEKRLALSNEERENILNFLFERHSYWSQRSGQPVTMFV